MSKTSNQAKNGKGKNDCYFSPFFMDMVKRLVALPLPKNGGYGKAKRVETK